MNSQMSYSKTERKKNNHQSADSEDCMYCPLKKPVFWPIVFLLFVFSPFIFSSKISNTSSIPQLESSSPVPKEARPQDVVSKDSSFQNVQLQNQVSQK